MKPLEETHPSLCSLHDGAHMTPLFCLVARLGMQGDETEFVEILQKHTIDKQILKDKIKEFIQKGSDIDENIFFQFAEELGIDN